MSDTETVPTAHGDVEYETVTCDSCGTEVMKKDAKRFVIGDTWREQTHVSDTYDTYKFNRGKYAKGWACEYCYDETVVGFPTLSRARRYWYEIPEPVRVIGSIVALGLLVSVLFLVVVSLA